jgi:hypothetical protein
VLHLPAPHWSRSTRSHDWPPQLKVSNASLGLTTATPDMCHALIPAHAIQVQEAATDCIMTAGDNCPSHMLVAWCCCMFCCTGVAAKAAPSPTKPKAQPIIEGKPSGGKASGGKPSSGQLGTSAVPAKPAAAKPQSKETGKPPSGKAAGGSVANMWSKAAAQPKSGAAAAAGPVLASQGSDKVRTGQMS